MQKTIKIQSITPPFSLLNVLIYRGIFFEKSPSLHLDNSIPVFQVQPSCGIATCETAPRPAYSQSDQRNSQTLMWQSGSQRSRMKIMILLLRPSTDLRGRPCYIRLSRGTAIQWGYDDTVASDSLKYAQCRGQEQYYMVSDSNPIKPLTIIGNEILGQRRRSR